MSYIRATRNRLSPHSRECSSVALILAIDARPDLQNLSSTVKVQNADQFSHTRNCSELVLYPRCGPLPAHMLFFGFNVCFG